MAVLDPLYTQTPSEMRPQSKPFSTSSQRPPQDHSRNALLFRLFLVLKRAGDIVFSAAFLLICFPILVALSLAIYMDDRGPVLFKQVRVGRDGRAFDFYKFRSMVPNAEELKRRLTAENEANGPIFKMRCDPRVTRIGRWMRKYSIDELPQMLNVLRGDMSLVGPRPHLPVEVAKYTSRQAERLSVRPGLICLREVMGRSNLSFERWVELDLMYVEHQSLWMDLRILLMAVPAIVRGDGAY